MEKANAGQKQFFKDLAATAEQFVQEARSFEENCYKMIQGMSTALPWLIESNNRLHRFAEQDFAAALEFTRVSRATDISDFVKSYGAYMEKCLQACAARPANFAEASMKMISGAFKAPTFYSPE
jgi:hypothetical protein